MKHRIYYVEYLTFGKNGSGKGFIKPVIKVTKHPLKAVIVWVWYKWAVRNHPVLKTEVVRLHRYDFLLSYNVVTDTERQKSVNRICERYSTSFAARVNYWSKKHQRGIEEVRLKPVERK